MPSPFGDPEVSPNQSPFGDPVFVAPGTPVRQGGTQQSQSAPIFDLMGGWQNLVQNSVESGAQRMEHGFTSEEPFGSRISDVIEGFGTQMSPLLVPFGLTSPIKTTASLIGGGVGGALGYGGASMVGARPETARAIGDLTAIPGGMIGHGLSPSPSTLMDIYSVARHPIRSLASAVINGLSEEPTTRRGSIPPLRGSSQQWMNYPEPVVPKSVAPPPVKGSSQQWMNYKEPTRFPENPNAPTTPPAFRWGPTPDEPQVINSRFPENPSAAKNPPRASVQGSSLARREAAEATSNTPQPSVTVTPQVQPVQPDIFEDTEANWTRANNQFHATLQEMELPGSPAGEKIGRGKVSAAAKDVFGIDYRKLAPMDIYRMDEFVRKNDKLPQAGDIPVTK